MTNYRLELNFRSAVRQLPSRELRSLRGWIRRFRRRRARTFYKLDVATGHWRRL